MRILNMLWVIAASAGFRWALREIDPMHPDVPKIIQRQIKLRDSYQRLCREFGWK